MVNRKNPIPLYIQLANSIKKQIETGEIKPGDKLPSEAEMIKQYSLGRLTIREALSILEKEDLIEKQHGRGSFCKRSITTPKRRINVLLNLQDTYFIPYYLHSICNVLSQENAQAILGDTQNSGAVICQLLEQIIQDGSDGVLIQPAPEIDASAELLKMLFQTLETKGIPYIMVDSAYDFVKASYVIMDEYTAGKVAAQYFMEHGHTHGCMIYRKGYYDAERRLAGFRDTMPYEPYLISQEDDMNQAVSTMHSTHPEITAVLCYNDLFARQFYQACQALSLSIPDDFSVIGVDDTDIALTLQPNLTSISHPKADLGEASAKAILEILALKKSWPHQEIFTPDIIERESCRKVSDCSLTEK